MPDVHGGVTMETAHNLLPPPPIVVQEGWGGGKNHWKRHFLIGWFLIVFLFPPKVSPIVSFVIVVVL